MKKLNVLLFVGVVMLGLFGFGTSGFAHGYVTSPGSRAYFGTAAAGNLNQNVGRAQWEPQSIEAPKNTFIDGKLASAGVTGFEPLDEQTATRWHKSVINPGNLTISWNLTAQHRTSTWDYYITKTGWNPNTPLKISDFELIAQIDDKATVPPKIVNQTITVPQDRKGYHVILAVWNISDTTNAFYQAIDVNIQ
ncbi:chitin binding protein [Enterococcus durans IPLA 655]|uniref:Chitin-binding protein n=2 Tax=Enterococcus durans TaxID=53345 RepID=A0A377L266_9ENTE|nr:lytic polysaccharide monooxygenase [Enterococcus durans]HCB27524.1 chitin-binding protein [Enterococcus sp.]EMS76515.1 chitin binding protein [Enterococcus durans IPLA 655]EOT34061.1 chitin binding protein [Enterococcus durans ATCC 6056]EOU26178.1 chitin binding protein [Enterococcus durans ATCC 6056]KST50340.1 chitin-binding protein [Enterococcus durans]